MSSVRETILRLLKMAVRWAAYGTLFVGLVGIFAYWTFSSSVRRGGMPAPDVLGLTVEQSRELVGASGLEVRHRQAEDRFDDTTPAGRILQQDPRPANPMKRGGVVTVVLSRGQQLVKVPDLSGKAMQAAQTELAAAGLMPGRISRVFWPGGEPNTVVMQDPVAEVEIGQGSAIELLVAIQDPGAAFVMPDLVYRRAEVVRQMFEGRGFRFGSVKYEPYEGVEEGVVLRHTPLAGHPLRRHDSITLVVAAGALP